LKYQKFHVRISLFIHINKILKTFLNNVCKVLLKLEFSGLRASFVTSKYIEIFNSIKDAKKLDILQSFLFFLLLRLYARVRFKLNKRIKYFPYISYVARVLNILLMQTISGDAFHLDSHQSPRVLPAGRRDHSADVVSGAAARKVPDIRHDTRLDKVSVATRR